MTFQLRIINEKCYQELVASLDRIASDSDSNLLGRLVDEGCKQLDRDEFLRWNRSASWLIAAWKERLDAAINGRSDIAVGQVSDILVALHCMPEFQFSYQSSFEISPTLVSLGDDDGGLYGILRDADPWFDQYFQDAFVMRHERYAYGQAMFLVTREELPNLQRAARQVDVAICSRYCAEAHQRFLALIEYCSQNLQWQIAVSET